MPASVAIAGIVTFYMNDDKKNNRIQELNAVDNLTKPLPGTCKTINGVAFLLLKLHYRHLMTFLFETEHNIK